jgi:ABC-2 type transport system ATP-binding protein
MTAVSLSNLRKRFGRLTVLDGLDLDVPEGSIYGLLGLNGAGKTTLLRILMGFLHPSGGEGTVLGRPLGKLTAADRARVAYVPDRPTFYENMRVGDLLRFVGALHPRWDANAARRFVDAFELPLERKVGALSTGMRTQLGLALALSTQPELLMLDEPASGLDPVHRRRYLQVLLEASAEPGRTVLLTSQDLGLVEQTCDHFALVHERRIQVAGPITEILESQRRMLVQAPPETGDALRSLPGVRQVRDGSHGFLVTGTALPDEVRQVAGVRAVQAEGLSLEDLFWSYVEASG